ncbi:hypothetical protein GCK72_014472 [Caenorhabditis remanei]|uniref:Uncharacterized protein n=1 Tax=Caenorhabditis remanei TaxID=31234 RepID=A0A6A5GTM8_CAERE|nr:hypothetical protein GCK72_014472 [Caenorhabditis remanei]KAF1758014.1 hypothetical protein GCK72_014472 [Caenorhabditis remanei]
MHQQQRTSFHKPTRSHHLVPKNINVIGNDNNRKVASNYQPKRCYRFDSVLTAKGTTSRCEWNAATRTEESSAEAVTQVKQYQYPWIDLYRLQQKRCHQVPASFVWSSQSIEVRSTS